MIRDVVGPAQMGARARNMLYDESSNELSKEVRN